MENNNKVKVGNYEYDWVDDFKDDGIAIAKLDGKEFHIGLDGKPLYGEKYDIVKDSKIDTIINYLNELKTAIDVYKTLPSPKTFKTELKIFCRNNEEKTIPMTLSSYELIRILECRKDLAEREISRLVSNIWD